MSKRDTYEARTEALLQPIVDANGMSIYDVEYVKEGSDWYLRAFIDKEGGVDINDCELVSRAMSELLDKEDFIEDGYIFEVSSPGLGRTLKKEKHLQMSLGEEVEVKMYQPIEIAPAEGRKKAVKQKEFRGILRECNKDTIIIEHIADEEEAGEQRVLQRKDIALIRLALDF